MQELDKKTSKYKWLWKVFPRCRPGEESPLKHKELMLVKELQGNNKDFFQTSRGMVVLERKSRPLTNEGSGGVNYVLKLPEILSS